MCEQVYLFLLSNLTELAWHVGVELSNQSKQNTACEQKGYPVEAEHLLRDVWPGMQCWESETAVAAAGGPPPPPPPSGCSALPSRIYPPPSKPMGHFDKVKRSRAA